jgi:hypothetical protein
MREVSNSSARGVVTLAFYTLQGHVQPRGPLLNRRRLAVERSPDHAPGSPGCFASVETDPAPDTGNQTTGLLHQSDLARGQRRKPITTQGFVVWQKSLKPDPIKPIRF